MTVRVQPTRRGVPQAGGGGAQGQDLGMGGGVVAGLDLVAGGGEHGAGFVGDHGADRDLAARGGGGGFAQRQFDGGHGAAPSARRAGGAR